MASMDTAFSRKLSKRTIRRGLLAFLTLAIGGLILNFVSGENEDIRTVLATMQWRFLGIILVCVMVDWLLGAYRLYIFGKSVAPHTTIRDYIRAGLANFFAAGLTPSQTGGGPAQIYILQRAGVPISASLALSIINLCSTLLFFFLGACLAITLNPGIYPGNLNTLVQFGFWAFSITIVLFGLFVFKPEWCLRMLWHIPDNVSRVSRRAGQFIGRFLTQLDTGVHEYKGHIVYFIVKRPGIVLKSLLGTVVLYFNKFLIAYFIVRMLGSWTPFWHLLFVQLLQFFIIYFAPTPGAGGVAEVSASGLMSAIIPIRETAYFALLWRFFTLYLALFAGGLVMMHQLNRDLATEDVSV